MVVALIGAYANPHWPCGQCFGDDATIICSDTVCSGSELMRLKARRRIDVLQSQCTHISNIKAVITRSSLLHSLTDMTHNSLQGTVGSTCMIQVWQRETVHMQDPAKSALPLTVMMVSG